MTSKNISTKTVFASSSAIVALLHSGAILAAADFTSALVVASTVAEAIDKIASVLPNLEATEVHTETYSDVCGDGIACYASFEAFDRGDDAICVVSL